MEEVTSEKRELLQYHGYTIIKASDTKEECETPRATSRKYRSSFSFSGLRAWLVAERLGNFHT